MKTERIVVGFALLGLIMKFLHLPFSSPLLIIALGTLAIIYFPGGFYFLNPDKPEKPNHILLAIFGLCLSISAIGTLFKIMYWPGAQTNLFIGCITLPVIVGIVLKLKADSSDERSVMYTSVLLRAVIWFFVVAALYTTPLATQIRIQHWNDPELARLKTQSYTHPEDTLYRRELNEYLQRTR
jgi:hypothetical protein